MTVEQGINRFYEEYYGETAPSSGTSIIASLNAILDKEDKDHQEDVGWAIYEIFNYYNRNSTVIEESLETINSLLDPAEPYTDFADAFSAFVAAYEAAIAEEEELIGS